MTFGEKLKNLRIRAGLTQDELAKKLNASKQSISRYENSTREPNIKTAKRIADALGVSLESLAINEPVVSSHTTNINISPSLAFKLARLDAPDQEKVEAFTDGLLAQDKYKSASSAG